MVVVTIDQFAHRVYQMAAYYLDLVEEVDRVLWHDAVRHFLFRRIVSLGAEDRSNWTCWNLFDITQGLMLRFRAIYYFGRNKPERNEDDWLVLFWVLTFEVLKFFGNLTVCPRCLYFTLFPQECQNCKFDGFTRPPWHDLPLVPSMSASQ